MRNLIYTPIAIYISNINVVNLNLGVPKLRTLFKCCCRYGDDGETNKNSIERLLNDAQCVVEKIYFSTNRIKHVLLCCRKLIFEFPRLVCNVYYGNSCVAYVNALHLGRHIRLIFISFTLNRTAHYFRGY